MGATCERGAGNGCFLFCAGVSKTCLPVKLRSSWTVHNPDLPGSLCDLRAGRRQWMFFVLCWRIEDLPSSEVAFLLDGPQSGPPRIAVRLASGEPAMDVFLFCAGVSKTCLPATGRDDG